MDKSNPTSPFDEPLADALALFSSLELGYALIGGVAAMYYGRERFREDFDFVVQSGHQAAFEACPTVMRSHRFDPTYTCKPHHASGMEIDLWEGEFVDGTIWRAAHRTVGEKSLRIAEPHDLVAMKFRAGRLQDDYDVSETLKATPLDHATLSALVTPAQFCHFLTIVARTR